MGLFDKIKNMFTEEVEDEDVKVEKVTKEVTKVTIESPKEKYLEEKNDLDEFELQKEEEISKPVFFDDNDFSDLNLETEYKRIDDDIREKRLYKNIIEEEKKIIEQEKKNFKPTPIISPVYGILDKNYHKEDIVSRNEAKSLNDHFESPIDTIRNKAYGTLEDELENTLFGTNSILFKRDEDEKEKLEIEEVSSDSLTDITDDISRELDELLIKKEKYLDIDEEINNDANINDDLLGFIDSTLYKEGEE